MTGLAIPSPALAGLSSVRRGLLFGLGAVAIWGGYLALAKLGITGGLAAADFALIRYATAGLVMLPWLLAHGPGNLAGVGWRRGTALALAAGPLFIMAGVGGYLFAPLAHGAVVQPAAVVIATTVLAALVFRTRPDRASVVGITVIIGGLAAIAGPSLLSGSSLTLLGDGMFAAAGLLWAIFTVLTRRWGIKALPATAAVSVISMLAIVPAYVATQDFSRIANLSMTALATQILVQGVLSGVVAVILFTRAAELLGPSRAAVFPALVPGAAILIGIPVAGEWPNLWQVGGLALVTTGLLIAIRGR
ncbi:MAG: DMT family transporter, partial [Elsteraceae bacterium]